MTLVNSDEPPHIGHAAALESSTLDGSDDVARRDA
jgi:hypothetical protein